MAIETHILAIGPHNQSLAHHYEYAPANYEHIARGTQLVTQIGPSLETRAQSEELADLVGASLDDPSSWSLRADLDLSAHSPALLESISESDFADLQAAMAALSEAGFSFFLRVDR